MKHLIPFTKENVLQYASPRPGEKKIGEAISLINKDLDSTSGKFVLIGISEDIGARANHGNSGAKNTWKAFLGKFLNMQANGFINTNEIIIAGEVNVKDLESDSSSIKELRIIVEEIDKRVQSVIEGVISAGKVPIVIGGGHNNCYPIINAFPTPIQVVNIDPHADIRKQEGRHSGNGFSYALEGGKLEKYFTLGLHEEYNSTFILEQFNYNNFLDYYSFNDYLKYELTIKDLINSVKSHLDSSTIGLEIDLDSIKNMPVSARTPIGFSEEEIRKISFQLSMSYDFHYIHICEGAPQNEQENIIVGKTIAYLVSDFIKYNS
ncbi:formimidoylglutamase [Flavobacteriales bacterium]|nr:formimidoylglutamase [Flavobacteriales bacterium]